jgi:hypothetical protein
MQSLFQYMESLAEIIRQGIEAARTDLKKESDERLMNEVDESSLVSKNSAITGRNSTTSNYGITGQLAFSDGQRSVQHSWTRL